MLNHLERFDAPGELDLSRPNPHSSACCVSSTEVLGPADLRVSPDALFPREEGHHWNAVSAHRVRGVTLDQRTGLVFYGNRVLTASGHGWRSARDGAFLSGAYARVTRAAATLRHWFASIAVTRMPDVTVSKVLGHARTSTTTDLDSHLRASDAAQIAVAVSVAAMGTK